MLLEDYSVAYPVKSTYGENGMYKVKLSLVALGLLNTAAVFAAAPAWSVDNLSTYQAGTQVSDNNVTYQCLPWPNSGWCKLAAYRPSGVYGADAWKKVGTPEPVDQQRTLEIKAPTNLPNGAVIEFVNAGGTKYKVISGKVTLPYAKSGTSYSIQLQGAEGTLSPSSYIVTKDSAAPTLSYKEAPTPPAGQCGEIPSDVLAWKKPGAWPNDHYDGGSFVSYDGKIWKAKWWTNTAPSASNNSWQYCEVQILGTVPVSVTGLNGADSFTLKLNEQSYTISKNGDPDKIKLAPGSYAVSVPTVVNIKDMHAYTAAVNPESLEIDKKGTYPLSVKFTEKAIQNTPVIAHVTFANGTSPNPLPNASITGEAGYQDSTQLKAGSNSISIPEYGSYHITPASYSIDGKKYVANSLNVADGKLVSGDSIKYASDSRVLAGYMPVSWNQPVKISEAAKIGYNVVLPAFVIVNGTSPISFVDNVFLAYSTWNHKADDPDVIAAIKKDITLAKEQYGLKYVIASVGGERNTFDPKGADVNTLAQKVVDFLHTYSFDGIDFDLEAVPADITQSYLANFIKALKAKMPNIIISGAPQVNNVNGALEYVNTGTQQVYNEAIKDGLFTYLFAQEYNTGGNFVDGNGNLCTQGTANCYDQKSTGFIVNSFYALEKITPKSTLIVAGQPATKAAAGAATVYNGPDASDVYNKMAEAYGKLSGESQFGGAMTWEISLDAANNYQFAKSIKPAVSQ